jgi:hypothetical protein
VETTLSSEIETFFIGLAKTASNAWATGEVSDTDSRDWGTALAVTRSEVALRLAKLRGQHEERQQHENHIDHGGHLKDRFPIGVLFSVEVH